MSDPAKTSNQNVLPVQAFFNLDGTFNTLLGQGQPFVITATESIGIVNSTVNATLYPTFTSATSGQVTGLAVTSSSLTWNPGTGVFSAPTFFGTLNGTANTANNLSGGGAGQLAYQIANGQTAFTATGSTGQFLLSNGTSAPSWATVATSVTIADQTTDTATYYPLFYSATSGSTNTVETSSTKLQYVPSTGTFKATIFSGSGASLTNIPNGALTNSSVTIGSTNIVLGGTSTTLAGLTSVTATSFIGALNGNANTATTATNSINSGITDNTVSSATWYPTFVASSSGNQPITTSSTKLTFQPSTGTLSTNGVPLTGNLGTVTSVATGIGLTGGPITTTGTIAIASTGVTAATYGSASVIPVITVNAQGQITSVTNTSINAPTYQGIWNAATNTPTLTSSVGTQGYYYVVSVAGTTNLDGVANWNVGDWAIFSGGTWEKIAGSSSESFTNLSTTNLAVTGLTGYMYANGSSNVTAQLTIPNAGLTNSSITLGSTSINLGSTATSIAGLTLTGATLGGTFSGSSITDTALTPTQLVYASTGGLLASSSGMTWSGTTLTVNTLNLTNALGIAYGGTNSTATPTAGGVGYGTGTAHAYSAAGTSGQFLQSGGTGTPIWVNISTAASSLGISTNSTNATYFPLFYTAQSGTATTEYTNPNYTFNPSTGTLGVPILLENGYANVNQSDIGTRANQIPLNQYLGTMAWQDAKSVRLGGDAVINTLTVGLGSGQVATNIAFGYQALNLNTTGNSNCAYGYQVLSANTTGSGNVCNGYQSGNKNTTGSNNSYYGYQAGYLNTTGSSSVGVGQSALYSNLTGGNNTALGFQTLLNATASNNTAIGYQAGSTITTGTNNIIIGYTSAPSAITVSNEITIGNSNNTVIRYPHNYSTVASLPSASTVGRGSRTFVTDALAPTFQATIVGGGAVFTPVYSDGTNWKVG